MFDSQFLPYHSRASSYIHCFPYTLIILHSWQVYIKLHMSIWFMLLPHHHIVSVLLLVNLSCSTCSSLNKQCNCRSRCRSAIHCFPFHFLPFFFFGPSHLISSILSPPIHMHIFPNVKSCLLTYCSVFFSFIGFEWAQIYIYKNIYMIFLLLIFCNFFTICFVELIIQAKAWLSKLSYMETLYQWRLWNCNSCGVAFNFLTFLAFFALSMQVIFAFVMQLWL